MLLISCRGNMAFSLPYFDVRFVGAILVKAARREISARPSWPTLSDSLIRSTWTRFSVHTGEPKRQILRPHRQSLLLLPAHDLALSVQYSGGREITENGVLKLGIPDTKFDQVADADEP